MCSMSVSQAIHSLSGGVAGSKAGQLASASNTSPTLGEDMAMTSSGVGARRYLAGDPRRSSRARANHVILRHLWLGAATFMTSASLIRSGMAAPHHPNAVGQEQSLIVPAEFTGHVEWPGSVQFFRLERTWQERGVCKRQVQHGITSSELDRGRP